MDILNLGYRKQIIDEINSDDNKRRKSEHQKRQNVFNDNQRDYVLNMLTREFSSQTVKEMRTCTSINLSKRIITEMASLYKREPERVYKNVSESQEEGIEYIYEEAKADTKLKKSNQKYKLHDQCAIQVLPSNGKIGIKLLAPHQYDVIPQMSDPESPFCYVISALNKVNLDQDNKGHEDIQGSYYGSKNEQQTKGNKKIADEGDYEAVLNTYIFWTAEHNLVCDENGNVLEANPNPIGILPFIDVAAEKDFEFWVRRGSGVIDFSLDFSVVLSDTCNTNRLQSYAQAIVTAEKIPEDLIVGPNRVLFLPIDPTRPEIKPTFEFASPQPDMKSSLDLQDRLVSYFLTAQGIDPKTITSSGNATTYTSGLERLLAMVERFEASQDDADLYSHVEEQLFELFKAWYRVTVGTTSLDDKYNFGAWPEDSEISVEFSGPEIIKTETDMEDSVIKLLEAGLMTKEEAIMKLRGVDSDKAKEIADSIDNIDQE